MSPPRLRDLRGGCGDRDSGAAVVEFVMVISLVLFVFLAVVELALLLHVRDVVTADAAEGARYEANAGAPEHAGGTRAEQLMGTTLGSGVRAGLRCTSTRTATEVAVTCGGDVALPFLPVGVHLSQTAHALLEQAP